AKSGLEAWIAQRRAALDAHVDGQRRAIEKGDGFAGPSGTTGPSGGPAVSADDIQKRRQAALDALDGEKKRMEALFERQRRRRERDERPVGTDPCFLHVGHVGATLVVIAVNLTSVARTRVRRLPVRFLRGEGRPCARNEPERSIWRLRWRSCTNT